jgi:hypothetical protein
MARFRNLFKWLLKLPTATRLSDSTELVEVLLQGASIRSGQSESSDVVNLRLSINNLTSVGHRVSFRFIIFVAEQRFAPDEQTRGERRSSGKGPFMDGN